MSETQRQIFFWLYRSFGVAPSFLASHSLAALCHPLGITLLVSHSVIALFLTLGVTLVLGRYSFAISIQPLSPGQRGLKKGFE